MGFVDRFLDDPVDAITDNKITDHPLESAAVIGGGLLLGPELLAGMGPGTIGAGIGEGAGLAALPAGGMAATGALGAAPWADVAAGGLGSGMFGTSIPEIGAAMGTVGAGAGGMFDLGSGLYGLDSLVSDYAIPQIAADQGANEWAKLIGQNDADPGSLMNTNLPFFDTNATLPPWVQKLGGQIGQNLMRQGVNQMLNPKPRGGGLSIPQVQALPPVQRINPDGRTGDPFQQPVASAFPFGNTDLVKSLGTYDDDPLNTGYVEYGR